MIEFLVDGEWCNVDYLEANPAGVTFRRDNYWHSLEWLGLGLLHVKHPTHGTIGIVPQYYPWRFV